MASQECTDTGITMRSRKADRSTTSSRITGLRNRVVVVLCVGSLAGCSSPATIRSDSARLRAGVWTPVSTSAFHTSGPDGELCVELGGPNTSEALPPGIIRGDGGGRVSLEGRVGGDTGSTVTLGRPNTLLGDEKRYLCFEQTPQMHDRMFRRVELLPTGPVVVRSITWWSGKRRPSM